MYEPRTIACALLLLIFWLVVPRNTAAQPPLATSTRTVPGVVLVKLKMSISAPSGLSKTGIATVDGLIEKHGVYAVEPVFSFLDGMPLKQSTTLDRIYYFRYSGPARPQKIAAAFARDPQVDYAEPVRKYPVSRFGKANVVYNPNDSRFGEQRHLPQVEAPAAWDVVRSGRNVVVAIVDGGTDWRHEDLLDNLWINTDEVPDNGIDDDRNGFIDDVRGWNFANDTNDPTGLTITPSNAQHGTAVAGTAAAVTDNGIGVAGASFNAAFMPINVGGRRAADDDFIVEGYLGIVYAAANGADVINCSWGGTGPPSRVLQDAVEFAQDQDALTVAAAGNGGDDGVGDNNDDEPHYPSSLREVLAVGATRNDSDQIVGFTNYGVSVDVFAPGLEVLTTFPNNTYGRISGTSFSSPLTAGVVALIRALHPDWSAEQVRAHLRATAESIDAVNDARFNGLLGRGRINAFLAVTGQERPSIRVTDVNFVDSGNDGYLDPNETATLTLTLTNFLANATGISVALSTPDPFVTVQSPAQVVSVLPSETQVQLDFDIAVTSGVPTAHTVRFVVDFVADGGYTDRDNFDLFANPPAVLTHHTGPLSISITAEGNIGWTGFADGSFGEGISLNGANLLYEGGLLVGTAPFKLASPKISDCIREGEDAEQQADFAAFAEDPLLIAEPGEVTHEFGSVVLHDQPAEDPIGLSIIQESYADTASGLQDFVIFRYTLINESPDPVTELHAGLFFDWDLNGDAADFANYDADRRLGFVTNTSGSPTLLAGTSLLTTGAPVSYRSIDNASELFGGDAGNGFTPAEKWEYLSGGVRNPQVDEVDVSTLIASGPYALDPGCPAEVAFAVIVTDDPARFTAAADRARAFWDQTISQTGRNVPPVFVNLPDEITAAEGIPLRFDFEVDDPDACAELRFSLLDGPEGIIIGERNGHLTYTPDYGAAGLYDLAVSVTDGFATDTARTTLRVIRTNRPPRLTRVLPDTTALVGQPLRFTYAGLDPDQEAVTYRLLEPPPNALINPVGGVFTFTPAEDQVGVQRITVVVQDSVSADTARTEVTVLPAAFRLDPPYPNPFARTVHFAFVLPEAGHLNLTIYDAAGRAVQRLIDEPLDPGLHRVTWNGRRADGFPAVSGLYFARIVTPNHTATLPLMRLR